MSLLVPRYTYKELHRDESSGVRLYGCPDGSKVPSVTTILSATKSEESKESLARWRQSVGEVRAKDITTQAASRGTRMHKYLEDYVGGIPLKESVSNPYAQESLLMAKAIVDNGFGKVDEVWGSEVPLYYPQIYAGTTDCVGIHNGSPAILDFKQSNKPKKREWIEDYMLQLSFYGAAHDAVHGTDIRKGVILMAVKPVLENGTLVSQYQEFIIEGAEWDYYRDLMLERLDQYFSALL